MVRMYVELGYYRNNAIEIKTVVASDERVQTRYEQTLYTADANVAHIATNMMTD